jgi:hypothetical protein
MKRRWLLALLLFIACPLRATTVLRLDLDGLVRTSTTIVVGTVESSESYWTADGKLILTRNTIRVQQTLKGAVSSRVVVTTVGGTLDDITLHVSGMATFAENEQTVVFVEDTPVFRTVLGLGQGKFSVKDGVVSNDLSNLEFVGGGVATPTVMPIELFLDEIRRRVRPF